MPLYFAYGSNMDEWQMKERRPSAQFQFVARIEGQRLCFPRFSKKRNGGVASIEPAQGGTVWGVVYKIPDDELSRLNSSEGFEEERSPSQNSYIRRQIDVLDRSGQPHPCYVYIANVDRPYRPSRECYLNYIIRGAEEHGIPPDYIAMLRRIAVENDS